MARKASSPYASTLALLTVALLVVPGLTGIISTASAANDWTQFHNDVARTGATSTTGNIADPESLQTMTLGGPIVGSPLIADLNGDGINDLVVVHDVSTPGGLMTVSAFRGAVSGGLQPLWTHAIPSGLPMWNAGFATLAVGDVDVATSGLEVVVYAGYKLEAGVSSNDGHLEVLNGATGVTIAAFAGAADIAIPMRGAPAIADVTGDGVNDIVFVRQVGGASSGYWLTGANVVGGALSKVFDTNIGAVAIQVSPAIGEFAPAHAGREVIIAEDNGATSKIYLCKPTTTSAGCTVSAVAPNGIRGIAIADIDGDGDLEIVANGRSATTSVMVFEATASTLTLASSIDAGYLWNTPTLGDIDGDGIPEIVNVRYSEWTDDTTRDGSVIVHKYAAGALSLVGTHARIPMLGSNMQSRGGGALAQIADDATPEFIFGGAESALVAIKFTGAVPSQRWSFPLSSAAQSPVAIGDLNGDGKAELVVGTSDGTLHIVGSTSTVTVPSVPLNLVAVPANSKVDLTWTAPATDGGAPVSGYRVYRGNSASGPWTLVGSPTATSHEDLGLVNAQTYFYQVAAVNVAGEGPATAAVSATPSGPAVLPSAPLGLSAIGGDNKATLVWAAPASNGGALITNYKIYRGTSSGSKSLLTTVGGVFSFVDNGVANGIRYYYDVSAVNSVGEGPHSAEASVTPAASAPITFTNYAGPTTLVERTGEPGIGVNWNTGNVLMSADSKPPLNLPPSQKQAKIVFDDTQSPPTAVWTDVTSPFSRGNIDPLLFTDSVTGRTFAGGWDGHCAILSYTDNDGGLWVPQADPCALPGVDHPTIGGGPMRATTPPTPGVYPNTTAPRIYYYCAQPGLTNGPAFCWRSLDGGNVFTPTAPLWLVNVCKGLHGKVRVDDDGTAYVPNRNCGGQTGFAVTEDNGLNWNIKKVPGSQGSGRFDPSVAPSNGNRVYFASAEANGAFVGVTSDRGNTWQDVGQGNGAAAGVKWFNLGASLGVLRADFVNAVAGDDDRAAVSFLGSTSNSANQPVCTSTLDHVWHMYIAFTFDGGRTWSTSRISEDPVQRGPLGDPDNGTCRNLLDFNDMQIDATGRVLIGYADGCVGACAGPSGTYSQSRSAVGSILRQSTGRTLFSAYDEVAPPLTVSAGGPYAATAGQAIQLAGAATGGDAPYTYTWSLLSKPVGSAATFSNANSATPTFTPDLAGAYSLQLSVIDAGFGTASATATLTASPMAAGNCQPGGVTIAEDLATDGGAAGPASEALCLRMNDDAQFIDFYIDLAGTATNGKIDSTNSLWYDLFFNADYAAGAGFLIEVTYDGVNPPTAGFYEPTTFLPILSKTATAEFLGNTLHVQAARSEILSPTNGQTLSGIYLDINRCEGADCAIVHDDYVPASKDGVYAIGGSSGGGLPPARCSVELTLDPTGDSTSTAPGKGRRDIVRLGASDDATTLTWCFDVADFSDAPTGAASTTTRTRYSVSWTAEYEGPQVAYSARAVFNPDGTLQSSTYLKGYAGASAGALGGSPLSVERDGNQIRIVLDKAQIGAPATNTKATGIFGAAGDDGTSSGTIFDRAPNAGAKEFTFGQTYSDTTPPSQVTGLNVADPQTGTTLNLVWNAATDDTGVTQYVVKRGLTAGGSKTTVGTPVGTGFTDSGLTSGTTYFYVVTAKDAAGNEGAPSVEASGTPTTVATDTTPPTVPGTPVPTGTSASSISIAWAASTDPESGVKHYKVRRDGVVVATVTATTFADSGLTPDTDYAYTVSAVNNVDLESAQSGAFVGHTLSDAFVRITNPTSGQEVTVPATFQGVHSTTGDEPVSARGGSIEDLMPSNVQAWLTGAFVQNTLRSPEFASLTTSLELLPGYLTAMPTNEDGGIITVLLSGAIPAGAPTRSINGWNIRYEPNVEFQKLMIPAGKEADAISLEAFESMVASGAPQGPIAPSIQAGIGPGGAIQMYQKNADGVLSTYVCTAAYLYEDAITGKYYLSTAGHCLMDENVINSVANPGSRSRWVKLCYSNCVNNYLGVGNYVQINDPVVWANQGGLGKDFGMIALPDSVGEYLRPYMWFWSGPTGYELPARGDALVHYGHGVGLGATLATQARMGVTLSASKAAGISFAGAIAPGDSGSSVGTAAARTAERVLGDGASGSITHIALTPNTAMWATDLKWGEEQVLSATGLNLTLVTEGATIRLPGVTPPPTRSVTITNPLADAILDPAVTPTVNVGGTATFAGGVVAGTDTRTYYLHRTACGTGQVLSMDEVKGATGSTCGSLAHPIGPVWEATLGPLVDDHPATPKPAAPTLVDPTRNIQASVWVSGYSGSSSNPQPVPSIINDIEVKLWYTDSGATKIVGSQRVTDQPGAGQPTEIKFSFPALINTIPANADLTFTVNVHHAVGPVFVNYEGNFASNVRIPLGTPTGSPSIQVAIDDATFATNTLTATGTTSWTAPWSLAGVSAGAHTIYARAVEGAAFSSTVSIPVTVQAATVIGPTADFSFTTNGLDATFTDASTAGSSAITGRSWNFGDGATSTATNPVHTYAAPGTYAVSLTVTDANAQVNMKQRSVTVATSGAAWSVQIKLDAPNGADSFDWTPVAAPADGSASTWSSLWSPANTPAAGSYTLLARILRDGVVKSNAATTFTVPELNQAPVVSAGPDQIVNEDVLVTLTATASDPDNDPLSISWTQVSGPAVTLNVNGLTATFTAPDSVGDTMFAFRFTANDNHGGVSNDTVSVTVRDIDRLAINTVNGQPPSSAPVSGTVVVAGSSSLAGGAGSNQPPNAIITNVVKTGLAVTASGASSTDIDGTIVNYAWDLGNGATRSGASLSYTYPTAGTYPITLTVTDNGGASGQAIVSVTVVSIPNGGLVIDAGDSKFVRQGDIVTLSAAAFGAQGAVSYTWKHLASGATIGGQAVMFNTTTFPVGKNTFEVTGTDSNAQGTSTVDVLVYTTSVVSERFDHDVLVALPDEDAGASGTDGATFVHDITVAPGTERLTGFLTWERFFDIVPDNPSGLAGGPNDFDVWAFSPGGGQDTNGATFRRPESLAVNAPASGLWKMEVRGYVVVDDTVTLFVNQTTAPVSPVPVVTETSPGCFSTPTQILKATATGGATGAWDLDLDGIFETSGMWANATFPVGSGAHLARFRATTADGYHATMTVAFRVETSCVNAPSVVVVGIADTGINPYHQDWEGIRLPYPELREFTKTDVSDLGAGDVIKMSGGVMLPFTKHPSNYIPGFPANAKAINLTLGGFNLAADSAAGKWSKTSIPLNTWVWFPGTKIIGAIDTSDTAAVNSAADSTPLYDDDGHGTASASVAVGNTYGTCQRCVLVFAESLNGDSALLDKSWIDFVSVSGGSLANVGTPDGGILNFEGVSRTAAERGQTISYAAGNGNENAFVTPENTYTSNSLGPDWTIAVGAVRLGTDSAILGTGKPVDWSSYGSGAITAACRNTYTGSCGHSGTSSATPTATGHMAEVLLSTRIALGDSAAGQKTTAQANGVRQAIAVGTPGTTSFLADGVLTRAELWDASFHCAAQFGNSIGFPGNGPRSAVDYTYGGYGVANAAAATCAKNAILNGAAVPAKAAADDFFEIDETIRDALWGDWDGNGDGQRGGNFNSATSLKLPGVQGITLADVDTIGKATNLIRQLYDSLGKLNLAPGATETYYLHHSGGCSGAAGERAYMDQVDRVGDDEGCGGLGTAPIGGELIAATMQYPSDVTTVGFPAGAAVNGAVYIDYIHPGAPIVTVVLRANGVEIGRSAPMQPPATGGFGAVGATKYAFDFVTLAPAAAGATLKFDVYIQGSESYFMGYEGATTSAFTITGPSSGGGGSDPLAATITAPTQGTELDPATTPVVTISGTATFPEAANAVATKAWLRYDGDADACGDTYLSLFDGPDGGDGCSNLLAPAGGLLDYFETYTLREGPVTLVAGGTVNGTMYFGSAGVNPGQMYLVLRGDGNILGSQRVTYLSASTVTTITVPFEFTLSGLATTKSIADLAFELHYEQQGAVQWTKHEDATASHLFLPVASGGSASNSVQIAIDDATFATGTIVTTGSTAWMGSWDISSVSPGPHTIYARAVQGATNGPATSVGITVKESTGTGRTPSIQYQAVPEGQAPVAGNWLAATSHNAASGAWSVDWNTLSLPNGDFDFHVRLLGDGSEVKHESLVLTLQNSRAPVIDAIAAKSVAENATLTFDVTATDLDGDDVTLTMTTAPAGATFTPAGANRGTFSWKPGFESAGAHTIVFNATDAQGLTDSETADVTVTNVNRPPVLAAVPQQMVNENATLAFTLVGNDPDAGDSLTYSMAGAPPGATLNAQTGAFSWKPTFEQAGDHSFTATVTDGSGETASQPVDISVLNVNRAPSMTSIAPKTAAEGSVLSFTTSATDPDGDATTITAQDLPADATFDGTTFRWSTDGFDVGTHVVRFTASDGDLSGSTTVSIEITTLPHKAYNNRTLVPFTTLQQAVDDAQAGDTILLTGGSFGGAIINKPGITVCAAQGVACATDLATDDVIVDGTIKGNGLADGLTVRGITFVGHTQYSSIDVDGVDGLRVFNSVFRPTDYGAIDLWGSPNALIEGNRFESSSASIFAQSNAPNAIIRDNVFLNCAYCLRLSWGSDNGLVEGNTFEIGVGNTYAVEFMGVGSISRGNTYTTAAESQAAGLVLDAATGARSENDVFKGLATGIVVNDDRGASSGTVVRGATFIATPKPIDVTETASTVDARLNAWGLDDASLVAARAGARIIAVPFLNALGVAEPALVNVATPASHTSAPAVCNALDGDGDGFADAFYAGGQCHFLTVQAAILAAHAGGIIAIPMSEAVDPTPRNEALTIGTNSHGEALDGLTICSTVVVGKCAPVSNGARWSTNGVWGAPTVPHQGQAIKLDGASGSTSLFLGDFNKVSTVQVRDITELGFDMLLESGACGAGSPRITLRIDTDNDGTADLNKHVYPSGFTCTVGKWVHVDFMTSTNWGNIPGMTQAAFHNSLPSNHRIISMNLIVDGSPVATTIWVDNQAYNGAYFRESADTQCFDKQSPTCTSVSSRAATILDAMGAAPSTLSITATNATVLDLTLRNTGVTNGQAIRAAGNHVTIANNDILGTRMTDGTKDLEFGVLLAGSGTATVRGNTITGWENLGLYLGGSQSGNAVIANNEIHSNDQGVRLEGQRPAATVDLTENVITQNIAAGIVLDTDRVVTMRGNDLGPNGNTLAFTTRFAGHTIDARANHWGVVGRDVIAATVSDPANHNVRYMPYLDGEGLYHPPQPTLQCAANTLPNVGGTPIIPLKFLDIQDALAATCPANSPVHRIQVFADVESYEPSVVSVPAYIRASGYGGIGGRIEAQGFAKPALTFLNGSTNSKVEGLVLVADAGETGIRVDLAGGSDFVFIYENTFLGTGTGIDAKNGRGPGVSYNRFIGLDVAVAYTKVQGGLISDSVIVAGPEPGAYADAAIVVVDSQDVKIWGSKIDLMPIEDQPSYGIRVHNSTQMELLGNVVKGSGTDPSSIGITLRDVTTATVKNSLVTGSTIGIYARTSQGITYTDNRVVGAPEAVGSRGIDIYLGSGHTLVGNTFAGVTTGLAVHGTPNVNVERLAVTGAATGVRLSATGVAPAYTQATNFVMHNATLGGAATGLHLATTTFGLNVAAACNDWGAYTAATVPTRIKNEGYGNSVTYTPYTSADSSGVGCLRVAAANFTATPNPAARSQAIQFTDTTATGSRQIISRAWDFGDNTSSTSQNPAHAYALVGSYLVKLTVTDLDGVTSSHLATVVVQNAAPVLLPIGAKAVSESSMLSFTVSATDADGDTLTYSATDLPAGATFSARTFSWTPGPTQAGTYPVTFSVTDGLDTISETVVITVREFNRAPTLDAITSKVIAEGTKLTFVITGSDPDGDAVSFSASGLPAGATFDAGTRRFTWTPTYAQAGSYSVRFTVTDGSRSANSDVSIRVDDVQRPPALDVIGGKLTFERAALAFDVRAVDPEGDAITLATSALPQGATFVDRGDGTGAFTWTPQQFQAGSYNITFEARDATGYATEIVNIRVSPTTGAPAFEPLGTRTTRETEKVSFFVNAYDPDGDQLTYTVGGMPPGATFSATTHKFSWTPTYEQAGTHSVTFRVSDGKTLVTEVATIIVENVNRAPIAQGATAATLVVNRTATLAAPFADPDGTKPVVTTGVLPMGATFDGATNSLIWRPAPGQEGTYTVDLVADDGEYSVAATMTLTVIANAAPTLTTTGPAQVDVLQKAFFTANATDPDGTAATTVVWDFDARDGIQAQATGKDVDHTYTAVGTYTVTVRATDADGMTTTRTFTVNVDDIVLLTVDITPDTITAATAATGSVRVEDQDGVPQVGATVTLDVFWNPSGDQKSLVRTLTVTTGADGQAAFVIPTDTALANYLGKHVVDGRVSVANSLNGDTETATGSDTYTVTL